MGLVWQLLLPSVLAAMLCFTIVQAWIPRVNLKALEQRIEQNLDPALKLLKLGAVGTDWSREGDVLRLGHTLITEQADAVDRATQAPRGVATIFAGHNRIATNARMPTGELAIGTKLTALVVREAVLEDG